jgi:drug/metabolite transporter superfamily protein YnfA
LSSEESFLVATHRVGSLEKLEPEFAKVNRNPLNLIIHGLILVFFSLGCFLLWAILRLPLQMGRALPGSLPGFTQLVMDWEMYLAVLPVLAGGYCIYVWMRRSGGRSSWMGFFASTMAVLFVMTLPILFAIVLPVIFFMQNQFITK